MDTVNTSSVVVFVQKRSNMVYKSDYSVDFWKEAKKRWMLLGVLLTVAMAVLTSRYGHPGGVLRTEYLVYLPMSYIYYTSGRTQLQSCRLRVYVLCIAHTHCVSLALCVLIISTLSVALDRRIIEGAILTSVSRPCAWLPLSLSSDGVTPALTVASYAASYVFLPLTHVFLCGRIPIQPIKTLIVNAVTVIVPFALGTLSQKTDIANTGTVLSALCVLYVECCKLLREAEGTLYIVDVIATLFLVVSWLAAVAISCYIYEICGLLTAVERNSLLLVATSKSTNIDYLSGCSAVGLARLPAVFSAPTQALLLSAIFVWPQNGLPR
nr:uncharacterized protein LOC116776455 isoform X1 [Danaus plexippus plexippus]